MHTGGLMLVGPPLDAGVVSEALAKLPIELREVIVAHLWGGLTFEQIGELSESSAATAHRRYVAGLTELRTRLNVSCEGIPLRKPRKVLNQSCLAWPNSSMS